MAATTFPPIPIDRPTASSWAAIRRCLLVALRYISISVVLTLFTKILCQLYPAVSPVLVLFSQAYVTLALQSLLSCARIPAIRNPAPIISPASSPMSACCSSISPCFSIPRYSCTTACNDPAPYPCYFLPVILTGARPTRATLVASVPIVCGTFAVVATDLGLELPAYALATLAKSFLQRTTSSN